jgi:hypothetical protein
MNANNFVTSDDGLENSLRLIIYRVSRLNVYNYQKVSFYPLPIDSIKPFCFFDYGYFENTVNKHGKKIDILSGFSKEIFEDINYTRFLKFENEIPKFLPTKIPLILLQYYRMSNLNYPISLKMHNIVDVIDLTKKFIANKYNEAKTYLANTIFEAIDYYWINKNGIIYKCSIPEILNDWYKIRIKTKLDIYNCIIDHAEIKFHPISSYIKADSEFHLRHNKNNIKIKSHSDVIKIIRGKINSIDDVLIEELEFLQKKYL